MNTYQTIVLSLLAFFSTASLAQAEVIYAVRVNALDAAGNNNFYSNYNFSNTSGEWVTQANNKPYNGTTPVMLCDLGSIQTINSINLSKYGAAGNNVKAMTIDFYDTPALSGKPVYTQTFTNIAQSGDTLTRTTPTNARFVKFTMTQNYGDNRYGVGNITFNVSSTVTPTSGTCNVGNLSGYNVSNLFDKSANSTWCSSAADTSKGYFNGTNPNPVFTFDLGGTKNLTGITVQAYNVTGNSIKNFNLEFLDANGNTIAVQDASKYSFKMWDSTNSVQNYFSFPEVDGVAKVKMTVTRNFRGVGSGGDRIGFSEVYFNTIDTAVATTPEMYNQPMHADNIVRPTSASFVTEGATRGSDHPLTNLFDGTGTGMGDVWYTKSNGTGEGDCLNKGYSSVIDFNMPSKSARYDSFSIGGYDSVGNQMTDFILELFDDSGKLIFADEFKTTQSIKASQYATFSLGDNYTFSKARMTILDNAYYWYGNSGGDRVGFSEIFFSGEPEYFINSPDIPDAQWTIDGSGMKGVSFTDGDFQTANFANPVILNTDGTFEIGEGRTLNLNGVVSGNGGLEKTGDGTLTLSGDNAYSGNTKVSEGKLVLTGDAVKANSSITIDNGATLEYNVPGDKEARLDLTTANTTVSGGNVLKTGTGALKVYATDDMFQADVFKVQEGELDFKGEYNGDIVVIDGAVFSPGNSVGEAIIEGAFKIEDGTLLLEQDDSGMDKLIAKSFDFDDDNAIIQLAIGALIPGATYDIIAQSEGSFTGDQLNESYWTNLIDGGLPFYMGLYVIDGNLVRVNIDANAVPEPSTWALLILGAAGLMFVRKRK